MVTLTTSARSLLPCNLHIHRQRWWRSFKTPAHHKFVLGSLPVPPALCHFLLSGSGAHPQVSRTAALPSGGPQCERIRTRRTTGRICARRGQGPPGYASHALKKKLGWATVANPLSSRPFSFCFIWNFLETNLLAIFFQYTHTEAIYMLKYMQAKL